MAYDYTITSAYRRHCPLYMDVNQMNHQITFTQKRWEVIILKIERISENQIRCTLTSFDLSVRNLNLRELAYGSEKARGLFREMLQKASNEVGFEADDIPLMVEAIPLSNESVMLLITKVEDPEELDTRFAKFSPESDSEQYQNLYDFAVNLLDGADKLEDILARPDAASSSDSSETAAKESSALFRVYRFDSLDTLSDAAKASQMPDSINSVLYKKPGEKEYYLVLSAPEAARDSFNRLSNLLSEYGTKVNANAISAAFYEEHFDTLIAEHALENLRAL